MKMSKVSSEKESCEQQAERVSWFENAFSFYAAYHDDFYNKLVHIFCVWPIFVSALVLLLKSPIMFETPNPLPIGGEAIEVNLSLVVAISYSVDKPKRCTQPIIITANSPLLYLQIFYALIELPGVGGLLASALAIASYIWATHLHANVQNSQLMYMSLGVQVFCWTAQILAHSHFEKRSPALLDNIFQAFVMAPLFVVIEVLFLLGYRPNLKASVQRIADKNIAAFRLAQAKKSS